MSKIKFEVRNNGPDESHNTRVRLTGLDNIIVETITPSIGYILNGHDWYIGFMGAKEEATLDIECSLIEDITAADITGVVSGSSPDLSPWNNAITVTIEAPQEPDPEPEGCPFTSDYSTGSINFGIRNGKTVVDLGGMAVDVIFAEGTLYPSQLGTGEVGSLTTDRPEKLGVGGIVMLMEDSGTYVFQCIMTMSGGVAGYESVLTIGGLEIPFQFSSTSLQAVALLTPEQRDALVGMDELCISVAEPVEIPVPEADLSVHVQPVAGEEDRYLVTVANVGTPLDDVRVSMHLSGTYTGNGYTQHYFDIDPDIEISHGELDSSTIPNWLVGRMEDADVHTMKIGIKSLSVMEDITMEFRTSSGYAYPEITDPNPDNNSFFYTFTKGEMPDPVTFHLNDGVTDDTLLEFDIMGRVYNIPVVTAYNNDGSREVEAEQVYYNRNNIFRVPLAAGDTRMDVTMLTEYGIPHTGVFKFPDYALRDVDARHHIIGVDWGVNTQYSGYLFDQLRELVSVPDFIPSSVTTTAEMFLDCLKINDPNIAAWDVSNVTDMTRMFRASLQGTSVVFNQDLSGWCVSNIPSEPTDFAATRSSSWDTSKHPVWGTCPSTDLPSDIGQAFGGGFYAGDIQYPDGQWYKLIIADVSSDIAAKWKTELSDTLGTDNLIDGVSNTAAMVAAGIELHPAAQHCVNHRGGEFEDWYLPALDELDVIYQNLGFNTPDCPPEFETGGPQAFVEDAYYWTSTQESFEQSHSQYFTSGGQARLYKTNPNYRVRPVRRTPFTP